MKTKIKFIAFLFALVPALAMAQGLSRRQPAARTTVPAPPAAGAAAASDARVSGGEEEPDEQVSDIYIPNGTELDIALKLYGKLVGKTVIKDPGTPDAKIMLVSKPGQKLTREEQIEALEAVFEMNGIHIEPYGESDKFVRTMARDKARGEVTPIMDEAAEIPDSSKVFAVMIPFKNIPTEEAQKVLEGLRSPKGQLLVYERIGKILVTDTGLNINAMRKIAKEIDVATPVNENVYVEQIHHASAADIKAAIEQIVQESQKELEKESDAAKRGENENRRTFATTPTGSLLRRPGHNNNNEQPAASTSPETLVSSVSDADRGLIRGKVLITSDDRSNKLIFITSEPNMNFFRKVIAELDVETTPEVEVKVVRLKYADAEDVADMINDLIGNTSAAKNNNQGNKNSNTKAGSGSNLTHGTSSSSNASSRTPANQRSGESKAGELSKDNVTVLADKRINGLVVMAQKDVWPTVSSIIDSMDVKLAQVLIETAIVEVTLGDELKTGIDWVLRGREKGVTGYETQWQKNITSYDANDNPVYTWQQVKVPVYGTIRDGFANSGSSALGGGGGSGVSLLNTMMSVGTNIVDGALYGGANPIGSGINYLLKSDKLNLAAVIQAAKDDSRSKYVASPIVMTVDNKEATIEATQMRYLLKGYTYSGSTYNGTTVPDYEQKEIGLTIKVTPKINPNGTVMLKVEEEYSQVGANQAIQANVGGSTTSTVSVPTTITRKMSADISLDNMQTVVLGGLTETRQSESETGIPILKDIPWIGKWLFSSTSTSEDRKELLVFMTPYVLNDADEAQAEALRRKNALSDAKPWESHGWTASPIADPVSQKEALRKMKEKDKQADEDYKASLAIEKYKAERAKELERRAEAEKEAAEEKAKQEAEEKAEQEAAEKEAAE